MNNYLFESVWNSANDEQCGGGTNDDNARVAYLWDKDDEQCGGGADDDRARVTYLGDKYDEKRGCGTGDDEARVTYLRDKDDEQRGGGAKDNKARKDAVDQGDLVVQQYAENQDENAENDHIVETHADLAGIIQGLDTHLKHT